MKIPFAKIEAFVSSDKEAPLRLRSVYFDRDNERLLATDGHIAIRSEVNDVEDDDLSGLIPVEVFDLARKELKLIKKQIDKEQLPDPWLKVTAGADAVIVENLLTTTTHIVKRYKDDTQFPDMDRLYPDSLGKPTITVGRDLLATVLSAIDGNYGVSLWIQSPDKTMVIAASESRSSVLLMPCSSDLDGAEVLARAKKEN